MTWLVGDLFNPGENLSPYLRRKELQLRKRTAKKLVISKETLLRLDGRRLTEIQLAEVGGGITKDIVMSGCSAGSPHCGEDKPPPPVIFL